MDIESGAHEEVALSPDLSPHDGFSVRWQTFRGAQESPPAPNCTLLHSSDRLGRRDLAQPALARA